FSEAASALNYTQSAVSQAIATLESEAGVPLLERDRRGVRPTTTGERLAEHAGRILTQLEAAEAELGAIAGIKGGELRMASFPTAGATLMPLAIASFRSAHPEVALSLVEGEPEELMPRLRDGEFDLALIFEFEGTGELGSGLRAAPLFEDPMKLALPKGHRLARKERIMLADLAEESWVQTSEASACARRVVGICRAAGFEPQVSFESDDYLTVQGLVAAGVGVALIPRLALSQTIGYDIAVRELQPDAPVRHVVVATPGAGVSLPAAAAMLEILRDTAERYRD
ncbi:MAG: LysR substrate-binding domain-containing protein, partial [Solirubrobacterales bacterium]|nr:LysR substrate-binding domain-containing protein [Solirubrobacterales bacterium]